MKAKDYLNIKVVKEFVGYLATILSGECEVDSGYFDRFKRVHVKFGVLQDAFDSYYWPKPGESYKNNAAALSLLQDRVRRVFNDGSAAGGEINECIGGVLLWGAGGKKTQIYTANMSWLEMQNSFGRGTNEILKSACDAFGESFDESMFGNDGIRSNAGFTKIYALLLDDFVIYDSRVAAALGSLVVRFCRDKKLDYIPESLLFNWMPATGADNRNPSTESLVFMPVRNIASRHAYSNWRANIVIKNAISKAMMTGRGVDWMTNDVQSGDTALRRVEAALFMLGKHVSGVSAKRNYADEVSLVQKSSDSEYEICETLSRKRRFIYREDDDGNVEFRFGEGHKNRYTVTYELKNKLCEKLRGSMLLLCSAREIEKRPVNSLGHWFYQETKDKLAMASYLAAYMVKSNQAKAIKKNNSIMLEISSKCD